METCVNVDAGEEMSEMLAKFSRYGTILVKRDHAVVEDKLIVLKESVLCLLAEYRTIAAGKEGGLGLRKENGFRELVQKDVGRFDVNLDHLVMSTSDRIKSEVEVQLADLFGYVLERIRPYLNEILTDQFVINGYGTVISEPGVTAQRWHVDSSHIFENIETILPCHFVTVFAPLFEYSEEVGPTEIALGSHLETWQLRNRVVEDQYPEDDIVDKILVAGEHIHQIKLRAEIGDIAIMDGRTLHRGSSNQSVATTRPLLYFSFSRPFYHEWPRSHSDARSLFS